MYREFNDYEILYLIGEKDDDVFDLLYQKYLPLIVKYTNKYYHSFKYFGYEKDDLMQIGYISLYKASRHYKEYCDNMFYTYLVSLLDNDYNLEYSRCSNNKQKCLNISFSYDLTIPGTDIMYRDIISDKSKYYEDMDVYQKIVVFKNNLPFDIASYFELKYNGYLDKEIIHLLDISTKQIIEYQDIIKKAYVYM